MNEQLFCENPLCKQCVTVSRLDYTMDIMTGSGERREVRRHGFVKGSGKIVYLCDICRAAVATLDLDI